MQPVLEALRALGGSGRPEEVKAWILRERAPAAALLQEVNKSGETRFSNQVDWARFYLVRAGYLDSSKRGVWALTHKGRDAQIDMAVAMDIRRGVMASLGETDPAKSSQDDDIAPEADRSQHPEHRQTVLERIRKLTASGFEQFCQRLLRESGFEEVVVTGRSGDGGIDGHGLLRLNPLVSFRVLFQCKKYADSVGAPDIRNFRGAMEGRADKGIVLTTGTFSRPAEQEASRDGAKPIELVSGDRLVRMMEELEVGVEAIRAFVIDEKFFADFENA